MTMDTDEWQPISKTDMTGDKMLLWHRLWDCGPQVGYWDETTSWWRLGDEKHWLGVGIFPSHRWKLPPPSPLDNPTPSASVESADAGENDATFLKRMAALGRNTRPTPQDQLRLDIIIARRAITPPSTSTAAGGTDGGWRPASTDLLHIVFDGPPGPVAGRFIEVEDDNGRSVDAGQWSKRPDGRWALKISAFACGVKAAAELARNKGPRPCGCETCYCGNTDDAEAVASWDASDWLRKEILALAPPATPASSAMPSPAVSEVEITARALASLEGDPDDQTMGVEDRGDGEFVSFVRPRWIRHCKRAETALKAGSRGIVRRAIAFAISQERNAPNWAEQGSSEKVVPWLDRYVREFFKSEDQRNG